MIAYFFSFSMNRRIWRMVHAIHNPAKAGPRRNDANVPHLACACDECDAFADDDAKKAEKMARGVPRETAELGDTWTVSYQGPREGKRSESRRGARKRRETTYGILRRLRQRARRLQILRGTWIAASTGQSYLLAQPSREQASLNVEPIESTDNGGSWSDDRYANSQRVMTFRRHATHIWTQTTAYTTMRIRDRRTRHQYESECEREKEAPRRQRHFQ